VETELRSVTVGDLTFDVRIGGPDRGPWVLLLHGFPVNGSCYDAVVPRLHESGLRTIVPDQRGYSPGARPDDVDAYRMKHIVSDAVGLLDALEVSYAILVGHDFGGVVAWHLAANHPDRFTGLVAVSMGHPSAMREAVKDGDQRERSSYIKEFVTEGIEDKFLAKGGAWLQQLGVSAEEIPPLREPGAMTAAVNWYRANLVSDISANMSCGPVEIPTTLVWSDSDPSIGRGPATGSARYVYSEFRFCELPDVDHWVPQNAAPALASEIALRSAVF